MCLDIVYCTLQEMRLIESFLTITTVNSSNIQKASAKHRVVDLIGIRLFALGVVNNGDCCHLQSLNSSFSAPLWSGASPSGDEKLFALRVNIINIIICICLDGVGWYHYGDVV